MAINPDNFREGGEELSRIESMANIIDAKLIEVVGNTQTAFKKYAGWDVIAMPVQRGRMGSYREVGKPIITRGVLKLYEEKTSGFCIGLMVDTPRNREKLTHQLRYKNSIVPANEAIEDELRVLGEELGIKTTINVEARKFGKNTKSEAKYKHDVDAKANRIAQLEKLLADKEAQELDLKLQIDDLTTSRERSIEKLHTTREEIARTTSPVEVKSVKEDENGELVETVKVAEEAIPTPTPEIKDLPEPPKPTTRKRPASKGRTTKKK